MALAICLSALGTFANAKANPVVLQQPTATFSQDYVYDFSVSKAIDGVANDELGWSIYDPTKADPTSDQTAVFETATDVGFVGGSILTFKLDQLYAAWGEHTLGRFRLSLTTDDRSVFADGLASGGDVTADWIVLDADSFVSAYGASLSELADHSILAGGLVPTMDSYTVTATTMLTGITGIRLELIQDPSLPSNGPGRQRDNGNFILSEFSVDVVPVVDCSHELAAVKAELAACKNALAAANQNIGDLVLPLQVLTLDFRKTFNDPTFEIRGATPVEQMQNLVSEILDLPRGQQQQLYIDLGGHKGKGRQVGLRSR